MASGRTETLANDGLDPEQIPYRKLPSGARMPAIGLGTFGSDHVSGDEEASLGNRD